MWCHENWCPEVKPIFKSFPSDKPAIEMPNGKPIKYESIRATIDLMASKELLTTEEVAEWHSLLDRLKRRRTDFWDKLTSFNDEITKKGKGTLCLWGGVSLWGNTKDE